MARRPGSVGKKRHDPQPFRLRPKHPFVERPRGPTREGQTAPATPSLNPNNPPPPAASWRGSLPEWVVYWWLSKVRKLILGRDFLYTPPLSIPGGVKDRARPDFLLINRHPQLALEVQGLHFHLGDPGLIAAGIERKLRFLGAAPPITMLFLYEDDLLSIPDFTLRMAVDLEREISHRPGNF